MNTNNLLNEYQEIYQYFLKKYPHLKDEYGLFARLSKITEELGELNEAILGYLNLQRDSKNKTYSKEEVAKEWADVFNTVMLLGIYLDLDIDKEIKKRLINAKKQLHMEVV